MAESMKSPFAIQDVTSHQSRGLSLPKHSQSEPHFNLINSSRNRKRALINPVNNVSLVERLRITGSKGLSIRSRRVKVQIATLAGFQNELVCEEDDEIDTASDQCKLPPWGICDEIHDDHTLIAESSSTSSYSKRPACLLKTNLHFLEERNENLLSRRIVGLSKSNKVTSALELYTSMEATGIRPSPHACNSLLSCLLRNGFLNNALKVFEKMKLSETTTSHTYSLILKELASTQGNNSALKMFIELHSEDTAKHCFDAIVYNTMITICGEANNWVETERLWASLKQNGHRGTTVTYRLLISIFARCGQPELAFDAYSEMVQINGIKPTEHLAQAVVLACTTEGKWALALRVFQSMVSYELNPGEVIYNALINSLGKAGEVRLAFRLFDLMRNSGLTPNAYTWNALIGGLNKDRRYADALRLFESIVSISEEEMKNSHLFNAALVACQRLGLWDRSLQLLWRMEASGMQVSTTSYNLAISACEAARRPKVALQVYERMVHKRCSPDMFTYVSLVRALMWGSLWSEVEEILDHVPVDVSLYNAVVQGMCLQGKMVLAKKMYVKMRESGVKADGKTRALMIQSLTKGSIRRSNR